MNKDNPAFVMSMKSRDFVANHDRDGWLGMFAENGIIEDPIGPSMLDPEGRGHSTPEAREIFYDSNIANSQIEYILHASHTSHLECANIVTLNVTIAMGDKKYLQRVDGVFTYSVNEEGKLTSLRGFWEFDEGLATLREIEAEAG
ncbi:MAG: steroid delta-isomerase [Halieaceae bacterium]|jgi:steroid delta-isomerase